MSQKYDKAETLSSSAKKMFPFLKTGVKIVNPYE